MDIIYRITGHPLTSSLYRFYEPLYLWIYRKKKENAIRNLKRLNKPVISIGNLTVGGTGKTPVVISIAKEAIKRGIEVSILSRGYKGRLKGPAIVSCKTEILLDEEDAGDEPVLMATKLPGIPIVIGRDRYEAGRYASTCLKYGPQLFLLDDGYQHWQLKRDLDILLVSALNPFGNRRLFPFGPLREPVEELKRADIIVITMTNLVQAERIVSIEDELRRYNFHAPLYTSFHEVTGIEKHIFDKERRHRIEELSLEGLKNRKVIGFAGIGDPESFRLTLISCGMKVVDFSAFRDHHHYTEKEINNLIYTAKKNDSLLITTEKDLIRCRKFLRDIELYTLNIDARCSPEFYEKIFSGINTQR